jgi:hypothetical protein
MQPILRARAAHEADGSIRTFDEDLRLHLLHGYVYSDPECFVMGRPVDHRAPPEFQVDPAITHVDPDCWLVYLAAGPMHKMLRLLPYELPWIGFERNNVLTHHRWKVFEKYARLKFR